MSTQPSDWLARMKEAQLREKGVEQVRTDIYQESMKELRKLPMELLVLFGRIGDYVGGGLEGVLCAVLDTPHVHLDDMAPTDCIIEPEDDEDFNEEFPSDDSEMESEMKVELERRRRVDENTIIVRIPLSCASKSGLVVWLVKEICMNVELKVLIALDETLNSDYTSKD